VKAKKNSKTSAVSNGRWLKIMTAKMERERATVSPFDFQMDTNFHQKWRQQNFWA